MKKTLRDIAAKQLQRVQRLYRKWVPYHLDDDEKAMCVALAALRMCEVNAQVIVRSNGLMDYKFMAMLYQSEALSLMNACEKMEQGSEERVSLEMTAGQLSSVAGRLEKMKEQSATDFIKQTLDADLHANSHHKK